MSRRIRGSEKKSRRKGGLGEVKGGRKRRKRERKMIKKKRMKN